MIWSLAIIGTFIVALFVVDKLLAAPKYDADSSDHFNGTKFMNPHEEESHHYGDVLKWWLSGNDKGIWHVKGEQDISQHRPPQREMNNFRITFVNHATFLLQFDGLNILTDPVWSRRASPYQWIGPERMRPPGIAFDDLPAIDVVLLSHNHYDHLDIRTVHELHERYEPHFVVPLGVEKFMHKHNITATTHLDWWDQTKVNEKLNLTAVPAQHFSGRGLFDRNQTLWCGYVLHTAHGNLYFAGDSGYGDFFKEIGNKFGPMQASLIPIGAYKPRWFMRAIHMSPEEAVQAHRDVQSKRSIAMHYGTFPMADDGMHEPITDLEKARASLDISEHEFYVAEEGDPQIFTPHQSADVA
ncbi:MAG: MBL fold metallo-hydrolase [Fodinibius sp.]|nr:MBL fold metallo-hydrolase [Fodinibius sp.]